MPRSVPRCGPGRSASWRRPGSDFPPEHLAAIATRGLDLGGIRRVDGPAIRYWVLYEADGRRTFIQRSPESAFVDTTPRPDDLPDRFWAARAFHLAAMPFGAVETLIRAIRARSPEAIVTLDTHEDEVAGFQDRIAAILPLVTAFLPSREEVASWFGWDDPERAILELGGLGQRLTIVKLGADGSLVHDARTAELARVGLAPGPVVDVTGAGDAFCGSVAAGLALGDTASEAARAARPARRWRSAASGRSTTGSGPTKPSGVGSPRRSSARGWGRPGVSPDPGVLGRGGDVRSIDVMLREIETIPEVIADQVEALRGPIRGLVAELAGSGDLAAAAPEIVLTGCGDSHFAGLATRLAFERDAGVRCRAVEALELTRYELRYVRSSRGRRSWWPCPIRARWGGRSRRRPPPSASAGPASRSPAAAMAAWPRPAGGRS